MINDFAEERMSLVEFYREMSCIHGALCELEEKGFNFPQVRDPGEYEAELRRLVMAAESFLQSILDIAPDDLQ